MKILLAVLEFLPGAMSLFSLSMLWAVERRHRRQVAQFKAIADRQEEALVRLALSHHFRSGWSVPPEARS